MRFMAIDPGNTVGWATGTMDSGGMVIAEYGQDKSKTFLLNLVRDGHEYDYIIYEGYTIRAKDLQAHLGSQVPTLQVIGGIRLAAWLAQGRRFDGFPKLKEQPATKKRTGMAAAQIHAEALVPLIAAALSGPHDDGHYGDALLHAVAYYHTTFLKKG